MPNSSDYCESVSIVSKCTILPDSKSSLSDLRLSASDLPMLTCQYIQKGCLFPSLPDGDENSLLSLLKRSFSAALSDFPPLAGRFSTDPATGHVSIVCSDAGASFIHARAPSVLLNDILDPSSPASAGAGYGDIPAVFKGFFDFDDTISYDGHFLPLAALQVTVLADAVFIGLSINHAVVDGTSFWNFFNTFAEISRGAAPKVSRPPCFIRDNVFRTEAALRFLDGLPTVSFSGDEPIRERIFHFSRPSILALKKRANAPLAFNGCDSTEITGKTGNDTWTPSGDHKRTAEISSFQSLSAQLWRSITRARNLPPSKTTTFRLAVNCRHRADPKMDPLYFGNAIQSIPTIASAEEVLTRGLGWSADLLHRSVRGHDDWRVRAGVGAWERDPRCFPLGNFDGAMIMMGSSTWFPMYDNDFGWGRPLAIRSGKANKFDGKISAFPGREGDGSVDLEVVLAPETMTGLERDDEFMQYVG